MINPINANPAYANSAISAIKCMPAEGPLIRILVDNGITIKSVMNKGTVKNNHAFLYCSSKIGFLIDI